MFVRGKHEIFRINTEVCYVVYILCIHKKSSFVITSVLLYRQVEHNKFCLPLMLFIADNFYCYLFSFRKWKIE